MSKNNLPIKMVLPKETDRQKNQGGGDNKFFGEVTSELQASIVEMFEHILDYYEDVFSDNELVPAVGKIIVKPEAIAKSHKPNDLCRKCPIIGSEDLNEMYIKVSRKTITETIALVENPPTERFKANLTAIETIRPIKTEEKISESLEQISIQGDFDRVKCRIKIKLFDFDDDFDNSQIRGYFIDKLSAFGFSEKYEIITYGNKIRLIKVEVNSYEEVVRLASINGVKSVDFFQEYSLPLEEFENTDLQTFLNSEYSESEISIGIVEAIYKSEKDGKIKICHIQ